jgi:hypothetical protein
MATRKKKLETKTEPKAPGTDQLPQVEPESPVIVPQGYVLLKAPLDLAAHFAGDRCQYQGKAINHGDQCLPLALAQSWGVEFQE